MTMASLTTVGIPKSPWPPRKILLKSHQYPLFISLKQPGITSHQSMSLSKTAIRASNQSSPAGSSSTSSSSSLPGLYSAQKFELTAQNVDFVLEDVRPYLISDGGNVDVVSVDDGVISLKLQGLFLFFFL